MTNEEIIKTTATAFFNDAVPNTPLPNGIGILISDVLKLKDQQFKEYLEKKREEIVSVRDRCPDDFEQGINYGEELAIKQIINELFK